MFSDRKMKRQLVYCSNTAKTGDPITPHNHHMFEMETAFKIKPYEMLLIVPRNDAYSALFQLGSYKHSSLRPSSGLYYICLNVYNNSEKIISIERNQMLKTLTQQNEIKKSFLIVSEREIHKMEHELSSS